MFVPGKLFQLSLMFVGKARGLPQSGAPERGFTLICPNLAQKHWTRLEVLAWDKNSECLQKSLNYGRTKVYSTGPMLCNFSQISINIWSEPE